MKNMSYFVWDFDGTLYDTYPVIISCLRETLQQFGHDCDPVEARVRLMDCLAAVQKQYAEEFGIDLTQLKTVYNGYWQEAMEALVSVPFDGVKQVLEQVIASGRKNYIFTNRRGSETVKYLKKYGYDRYFTDIVGQESPCFAMKPEPDALLYLMEKNQLDPAKTVMIGDRYCDLESGRRAGTKTAHVVCEIAPETLECDWRIENYGQMLDML